MKKSLGKIIIFLILGVFLTSVAFVIAQENTNESADTTAPAEEAENSEEVQALNNKIEENKNKIESLKKAADEYAQKIEEYKGMSANLKNQLGLLDNQIIKVELDAKTVQLKIDKTKLEIESMDFQINQNENEIEKYKQNIIEYIRQIAQNDQKSYLEILIINDSFSEFFNQITYLEQIQADLQSSIDHLRLLKEAVDVQKSDKEKQKQDLEAFKTDLQSKEYKLVDEQNAKENILLETKTSEIQFQKLLQEAKQKQNQIDADIKYLQSEVKDKLTRLRKEGTTVSNTFVNWPVPSHFVTAYFHDPDYPFRYVYEHPAIDIRAKQGTPISAPADGYVARTVDAGYGYSYIIIIHDNGLSTVYGHVSTIYVKTDNYVQAGDIIGLSGGMPGTRGAGRMTIGPHLHFEARLNGIPVNPLEYLP
jgi:murein DD-endopeptidase MepM/ murein hydrolase activator NlpD